MLCSVLRQTSGQIFILFVLIKHFNVKGKSCCVTVKSRTQAEQRPDLGTRVTSLGISLLFSFPSISTLPRSAWAPSPGKPLHPGSKSGPGNSHWQDPWCARFLSCYHCPIGHPGSFGRATILFFPIPALRIPLDLLM